MRVKISPSPPKNFQYAGMNYINSNNWNDWKISVIKLPMVIRTKCYKIWGIINLWNQSLISKFANRCYMSYFNVICVSANNTNQWLFRSFKNRYSVFANRTSCLRWVTLLQLLFRAICWVCAKAKLLVFWLQKIK